ncbi:hypothetical protein ACFY84_13785 [Streptomyces sp. NPDC012438]|uniref:hypothetical protein n=1 Tax=Streptomyces sp. NPDC012438 TaxID=3364833 RepID=UPI0036E83F20
MSFPYGLSGETTRIDTRATVAAGLLLVTLTACGDEGHEGGATAPTAVTTAVTAAPTAMTPPATPAHTVANKIERGETGSVDLVLPNATAESAEAAIEDHARTIDGPSNHGIDVIRDKADDGPEDYVCHGEWVKDAPAARVYTGGRVTSDTWPALGMYCSDRG